MSEIIDTSHRIGFTVSKDTYAELFKASEELPDEAGRSNNKLGRYVRELLADPGEAVVSETSNVEGSRPYTRKVGLYVNADEWSALRDAFEESALSEDYRGEMCAFSNQPFSEMVRRIVVSRMD